MGRWMNVRLILHKYNSYLMYGMCSLLFLTQLGMIYEYKNGRDVRVKQEDLFVKDEYVKKFEKFISKYSNPKDRRLMNPAPDTLDDNKEDNQ